MVTFASRAIGPASAGRGYASPPPVRLAGSAATHQAASEAAQPLPVALGFAFQFKACVLMSLATSKRRDALHEIKDAFRLAIFLAQNGFDDLRCLGLGKPAPAEEGLPVLVRTSNDPRPRGLDTGDEW